MGNKTLVETNVAWDGKEIFTTGTMTADKIQVTGMGNLEDYPSAWSPVHMYISSIEACYFATLKAIFAKARIGLESYKSTAVGELTSSDGKNKEISKITIHVEAGLEKSSDENKAMKLMKKMDEYCYVARSVKTEIATEIMFV